MSQRVVWQVDPLALTPYYDAALCEGLAETGWTTRLFTSSYLYDPAFRHGEHYSVELVYGGWMRQRRWLKYPHLCRSLRLAAYVVGHRRVIEKLDIDPPDVVHIQWSRLPQLDRWLVQQIKRRGIRVVHTVHDVEPLFGGVSDEALGAVYQLADRLIVHAPANCPALSKRYPALQHARIRVIAHPATAWDESSDASHESARRLLGIPDQAMVALFFGTARLYKGLDVLLAAFAQARKRCPDLWLVVAGMQPSGVPINAQFDRQVMWERAYIPADRVWMYHRAADVVVFPYRRISQSGALITAMGFSLPVIVSDVGGLPETVHGNGWVVPPNDTNALAEALVEAVQDKSRLRGMGERSFGLIEERHAPSLVAAQTAALYEEVLR